MSSIDWAKRASEKAYLVRDFIAGRYADCSGNTKIEKRAPRDGSLLYTFGCGSVEVVDQAVACARKAHEDARWSGLPAEARKVVLLKLADLLEANREEFALNEAMDVGKPITNALYDDISRASGGLREAAGLLAGLNGPSVVNGACFSTVSRRPLGVVGAIVGWNYPLALAVSKIAPALAAGNSMVLKPSEFSSLSAARLAEFAVEAGVPEGVFNVVHGTGAIVGDALARHPDVRLLSFTGSSETGKRLLIASGQSNMKRLMLECGGKSPFLIFEDHPGSLDDIVAQVLALGIPNQGALCVSATRLLVHKKLKKPLLEKLVSATQKIVPDDPLLEGTTFGALINETHMEKVLRFVKSGDEQGAKRLCGGEQIKQESGGYYVTPAIFDDVKPSYRIAKEEIFGPLISVFSFETEEEAISLANNTEFGLAAYAATTDAARLQRLSRKLEAGVVMLMADLEADGAPVNFGVEPHKQSGFGPEGGPLGLQAYTATSNIFTYG